MVETSEQNSVMTENPVDPNTQSKQASVSPSISTTPQQQRQPKCVIKGRDMPEEMANAAVEVTVNALDRFELERDMAMFVKQEFDKRYQPTWHCIVGRHFGSYVSHEMQGFIYFYIDKLAVLLFRSGDTS